MDIAWNIIAIVFASGFALLLLIVPIEAIIETIGRSRTSKKEKDLEKELEDLKKDCADPIALKKENDELREILDSTNERISDMRRQMYELRKDNDEISKRNLNQAIQLRELRESSRLAIQSNNLEIEILNLKLQKNKEIILRQTARIGELQKLAPECQIRRDEIRLREQREELAAREEARVGFTNEFKKAIDGNVDFAYLEKGMNSGAFERVFKENNSILSLKELHIQAIIDSEHTKEESQSTLEDKSQNKFLPPYTVTLKSCTCRDFAKRNKPGPCKHIIYLAYSLGLLQADVGCQQKVLEQYNVIRKKLNKYKQEQSCQKDSSIHKIVPKGTI